MVWLGLLQTPVLALPANTAYVMPEETGIEVAPEGILRWGNRRQHLEWGGWIANEGELTVTLRAVVAPGEHARFRLEAGSFRESKTAFGEPVEFGPFPVKRGWLRLRLFGESRKGPYFGAIQGLELRGTPAMGARFNLTERRNSASVHLWWGPKPAAPVRWFYNEIVPQTEPLHTFYMACGFHRGYFGMQVNSKQERRIIFSVWDSGNEAVDRGKVAEKDRVVLVDKDPDVVANDFGNEGTGGHSHWKYKWRMNGPHRFLLRSAPTNDGRADYTAWYRAPEMRDWKRIATFRAPHDDGNLRGLYSFVENFWGTNGNLLRRAEFGPAWVRGEAGEWVPLPQATFTHDGTGAKDRWDYEFGARGERVRLQNGGFAGPLPVRGDLATAKVGQAPKDLPRN